MRSFYYVDIANANEPEIREELQKVSIIRSLGYYEPSARFLTGIRQKSGTRRKKGLFFDYDEKYYFDDPVPMICELKKNSKNQEYFVDVISQNAYWKGENCYGKVAQSISLIPMQAISSDNVVMLLKSLTPEQIKLYKTRAYELNNAMFLGYQAYARRVNDNIRQQRENEDFIDNFTRKYKK